LQDDVDVDQLSHTLTLTSFDLALNKAIDRIICIVCETVVPTESLTTHLGSSHTRFLQAHERAALQQHVSSLGIPQGLPPFPMSVISAIQGLKIVQAHYCPHCSSAYPSQQSYKKHRTSLHPGIVDSSPPLIGPAQHFTNGLGRIYFRVTIEPPSTQVAVDRKKPIMDTLAEIEDRQRSLVAEIDIRNVSPWLRITKWHEMFRDHDTKHLRSLVADPSDIEFPNLRDAALFMFHEASDLIDSTTPLVLQTLLSPNGGHE